MVRLVLLVAVGCLCGLLRLSRPSDLPVRCPRRATSPDVIEAWAGLHLSSPPPPAAVPIEESIDPTRLPPPKTLERDAPTWKRLDATRVDAGFDEVPVLPALQERLWHAGRIDLRADPAIEAKLRATTVSLCSITVSARELLDLVLRYLCADGEIVYDIRGETVWLLPSDKPVLRIHPVADLLLSNPKSGMFFNDEPLLSEQERAELKRLAEIARYRCAWGSWNDKGRSLGVRSRNLLVSAPITVQIEIADFLDSLRTSNCQRRRTRTTMPRTIPRDLVRSGFD